MSLTYNGVQELFIQNWIILVSSITMRSSMTATQISATDTTLHYRRYIRNCLNSQQSEMCGLISLVAILGLITFIIIIVEALFEIEDLTEIRYSLGLV